MYPSALVTLAMVPLLLTGGGAALKARRHPSHKPSLLVTTHLDDPDLVLLEVSSDEDYRAGHIRRARPVDIMAFHGHGTAMPEPSHFVSAIEALGISNSSRLVIYGDNMATSLLFVVLDYLGLGEKTAVLDGGKPGWKAVGKTLSRENPTYLAGKFVPNPRPEIIVDASWLVRRLSDSNLALIDARSSEEYAGAPDPEVSRPGHIPGAASLDWVVTFDSTGRLLPAAELRSLFAAAGYENGDQLVLYCTVGMRASHLYFVARHLGYSPRLYLGSMNDWASDPARPVARSEAH
jgi:thiosulfate/3-mercaptopyruvate sulfurtransferase